MRKENNQQASTRIKTALLAGFLFLISGASCAKTNENLPPACRNRYDTPLGDIISADIILFATGNTGLDTGDAKCMKQLMAQSSNRNKNVMIHSDENLPEDFALEVLSDYFGVTSPDNRKLALFGFDPKTKTKTKTMSRVKGPTIGVTRGQIKEFTITIEPGQTIACIQKREKGTQDNTITIKSANETMKSVM